MAPVFKDLLAGISNSHFSTAYELTRPFFDTSNLFDIDSYRGGVNEISPAHSHTHTQTTTCIEAARFIPSASISGYWRLFCFLLACSVGYRIWIILSARKIGGDGRGGNDHRQKRVGGEEASGALLLGACSGGDGEGGGGGGAQTVGERCCAWYKASASDI
ncbi:hypothetical protein WAI453_008490 [Rhynchosporium graminicola]|uniref:Uncharacterized protein n=1 Tax=Rhynchosporium graminicola TaxID=2792576 RepID=A0A1E1KLM4_9HELO|nr:uncharacterized protein RCO7_00346 [Rhynchosporium commune]